VRYSPVLNDILNAKVGKKGVPNIHPREHFVLEGVTKQLYESSVTLEILSINLDDRATLYV